MLTPPCFVGYEVSESEWHWVLFGIGCYLAVVMNLCNRQVVDWKLRRYHDSQLLVDALHHAMLNVTKTTKMMSLSDQGSIYGSQLLS